MKIIEKASKIDAQNDRQSYSDTLDAIYLGLSFLSSILELGPIVLLLKYNLPPLLVLGVGLVYQLGNLAASTLKISHRAAVVILGLAVISSVAAQTYMPLIYIAVLLMSMGLQRARRYRMHLSPPSSITTFKKRFVRIVGFMSAGFFLSYTALIILSICIFVLSTGLIVLAGDNWSKKDPVSPVKANRLSLVMLSHQTHYFSYTYLMPLIFVQSLSVPLILLGFAFILGWISYISSERLFGRYNLMPTFVLGHIVVAVALITIASFYETPIIVFIAWFITGLGGGTVFSLKRLNKTLGPSAVELDFWEDAGHVLGVVIMLLVVAFFPRAYPIASICLAAIVAIITATLMVQRNSELQSV